jgi:hypothetical protein
VVGELANLAVELMEEINPPRRLRSVLRQVKRKMSRFLAWNPARPQPPQPTKTSMEAVTVIPPSAPAPDT